MTLSISGLKKDQIRALEFYLRRKYDSIKNAKELTKLFLLEFVAAEAQKESDAAIEKLNGESNEKLQN